MIYFRRHHHLLKKQSKRVLNKNEFSNNILILNNVLKVAFIIWLVL